MENNIYFDFISLFFPRYCYACKEQLYSSEEYICLGCKQNLPRTNYQIDSQNPVYVKMYGKAPITFASAYLRFVKFGKTQQLLHQLKYHDKPEIGNVLGKWFARDLENIVSVLGIELITPVPLHKSREKKRGYNQSEGFAQGLSEGLNIQANFKIIERFRKTETQTNKSKIERWKNMENVFRITEPKLVKNKHIFLIDDVITTGSTLASCANELLNNEAEKISIATIAVAEHQ